MFFKDKKVGDFKADLVAEEKIIVEINAVTGIMPEVFQYQVISYLKASGLQS